MSGREKLSRLGIELPPLPITAVGSYAKPETLLKARTRFARGDISRDELRKHEEEATAAPVRSIATAFHRDLPA